MTQSRIHDYRSPRSSADLNRKLVGILPPGVYAEFTVHADGSIDPGVMLTPEGVRIEEDGPISVSVPPGDSTHPRLDLVVCIHEYLPTVPNVAARLEPIPVVKNMLYSHQYNIFIGVYDGLGNERRRMADTGQVMGEDGALVA